MLQLRKLPTLTLKKSSISKMTALTSLLVGAICSGYAVYGRNFSSDCVFPNGTLYHQFTEAFYPEAICGALATKKAFEVGRLVLDPQDVGSEGVQTRDIIMGIQNDLEELKQRAILHDILSHKSPNLWQSILDLKNDIPYSTSGTKQYFSTKIPHYIVIYDTVTRRIDLANTENMNGRAFRVLESAEFQESGKK